MKMHQGIMFDNEDYPLISRHNIQEIDNRLYIRFSSCENKKIHISFISLTKLIFGNAKAGFKAIQKERNNDYRKQNLVLIPSRLINNIKQKFCGITFNQSAKSWRVVLCKKYLGSYQNDFEAARAWDMAVYKKYGCIEILNFPEKVKEYKLYIESELRTQRPSN